VFVSGSGRVFNNGIFSKCKNSTASLFNVMYWAMLNRLLSL
jgi:hypothetical protein